MDLASQRLDTTVAEINDTTIALNIMGRLKTSSSYSWIVEVTDGYEFIAPPTSFSFRTSAYVTRVENRTGELPLTYALEQNYPNPFNPATRIRFALPVRERVSLKVFDMLGNEVAVLIDDEMPAGRHEVNWEPGGLSSGVYFCQLRAGKFVQMKNMLVTR